MTFPFDNELAFADAVATCANFLEGWKALPRRFADVLVASNKLIEKKRNTLSSYGQVNDALVDLVARFYRNGVVDPSVLSDLDTLSRELGELSDRAKKASAPGVSSLIHRVNKALALLEKPQPAPAAAVNNAGPLADSLQLAYEAMSTGDVAALEPLFSDLD